MALTVNDILEYTKFLLRKNQAGGVSSDNLFYAWNAEQSAYQQDLLGRWQARNNGKEGANTGLIENETILQKLAIFTKPITLTITTGHCFKPADFLYRLALRINGYDAVKINHNQIASVNNNVIDPPSITGNQYYFVEYEDYYSFLPSSVTLASLDYISFPTNIVWGYTFDSDGRQVYNPGTSKQPEWQDADILEITKRTLKGFGISFKDADFTNFANSNITTGD